MHDDGYLLENMCRLLKELNEMGQVIRLLFTPQWIVRRLRAYGIFAVESDIAIGIEALHAMHVDRVEDVKTSLRIVAEAARLSVHAVTRNPHEAYFQLYGRLVSYASKCEVTKKFVDELEIVAEKPWAKPSVGFLTAAGEATRDGFRLDGRATAMAISDSELVVGNMKNDEAKVTVYDRKFGSLRTISCGSNNQLLSMTNDGTLVAVVDQDGNVSAFESKSGKQICHLRSQRSYRAVSVSLSDNGKWVACVTDRGIGYLWDTANKNEGFEEDIVQENIESLETFYIAVREGCQYPLSGYPDRLSFVLVNSASNRFVTSFSSNAYFVISRLVPLQVSARLQNELDNVSCMAMSPSGKWIAVDSWDGYTRLWDADAGKEEALEGSDSYFLQCIAVSDNTTIIGGLSCGKIFIWNLDITNHVRSEVSVRHGADAIRSVAISGDGCLE